MGVRDCGPRPDRHLFLYFRRNQAVCTNPVSVLEKIMVHIHVPFPYATALFVATVEFACGAGLTLGLLTPLCAAMLTGGMIVAVVTTSIHTIQATRVLAWLDDFPDRPEVLYVLTLVWLIFSGRVHTASMASRRARVPE